MGRPYLRSESGCQTGHPSVGKRNHFPAGEREKDGSPPQEPPARLKVRASFPSAQPAATPEGPTAQNGPSLWPPTSQVRLLPTPASRWTRGMAGTQPPRDRPAWPASVYLLHLRPGLPGRGFLVARRLLLRQRGSGPKRGRWQALQVPLGWRQGGRRAGLGRGLGGGGGAERSRDRREGSSPGSDTQGAYLLGQANLAS